MEKCGFLMFMQTEKIQDKNTSFGYSDICHSIKDFLQKVDNPNTCAKNPSKFIQSMLIQINVQKKHNPNSPSPTTSHIILLKIVRLPKKKLPAPAAFEGLPGPML